jgi:hypothetical protein
MDLDDAKILRQAVDERHLLEIASRWKEWHSGDLSTVDAAYAAYLADPRCRFSSPNPLFDEWWYRQRNPDVARAIREGQLLSGFAHFVRTGVFEGRPFNDAIERRIAWCTAPAAPVEFARDATVEIASLDDESRIFLEKFPHVPVAVWFNRYGRFLGATPGPCPPVRTPRTGILVLGMHRSGTSMLSASLVAAGARIGNDLIPATPANPIGHWESNEIARTLDRILARAGSSWDDDRPVAFPDDATRADAVRELVDLLDRRYRRTALFSIKDPRSCRLVFLWREAFAAAGIEARIVTPVRHPAEVAASLEARNGFPAERGFRLWGRHLLDALRQSRGLPRVVTRHRDLLADAPAEIERIGAALGLRWPVSAAERAARITGLIKPGLHRQRTDASIERADLPWLGPLWSLVDGDPAGIDSPEAAATLDAFDQAFSRSTVR